MGGYEGSKPGRSQRSDSGGRGIAPELPVGPGGLGGPGLAERAREGHSGRPFGGAESVRDYGGGIPATQPVVFSPITPQFLPSGGEGYSVRTPVRVARSCGWVLVRGDQRPDSCRSTLNWLFGVLGSALLWVGCRRGCVALRRTSSGRTSNGGPLPNLTHPWALVRQHSALKRGQEVEFDGLRGYEGPRMLRRGLRLPLREPISRPLAYA
jgi:hypothetical protein